jgi:autotransporter-associated beta strand protein
MNDHRKATFWNKAATTRKRRSISAAIAFGLIVCVSSEADAALSFNVAASGWPNAAHRDAAVAAIQSAVNRYNAYGNFGNYNVHVYYNSGIPTAQANYLGSIGFGGTYPNERVMMHELAHYLGSGTYGDPWDGARGEALIDQFDGLEATLQGDANHFWPYGLNFDSEGAEINKQRQVAMVYAQRADMGIGSTANPWSATSVNLTASDALGESGFHYASKWSDGRFAHPGAAYSTGNFFFRTPASGNSFTFVGDSLTVNNTNGISGGLLYKGTGTTGVVRFANLILDGGYVRHANGAGDLFRLAGNVTLASSSTIDAAQGNIAVSASIGGSGSFTKVGSYTLTISEANTYGGSTSVSAGTLVVDGSTGFGATTVASGATIAGRGVIRGDLAALTGSTVRVGAAGLTANPNGGRLIFSGGAPTAYTADGNTVYLFHLDDAAGSATAAYTGTAAPGPTAYAVNINAAPVTHVFDGSAGLFGGAANMVGGATENGIGLDVSGDGAFALNAGDEINFSTLIGANNAFTLEAAVKPNTANLTDNGQIWSMDSGTGSRGFQFRLNSSEQLEWNPIDLGGVAQAAPVGNINPGTWYHAAITHNAGNYTMYWTPLDGSFTEAQVLHTWTSPINTTNLVGELVLGNEGRSNGGLNEAFPGLIDEARLSNVARGPAGAPTMNIQGSLVMNSGATLSIDIATPSLYDRLAVGETFTAAGTLHVTLVPGAPAPQPGDEFDILDFGSASGAFAAMNLPTLASGLAWNKDRLLIDGVLQVDLAGDFNSDGAVDASDYVMLSKLGGSPSAFTAWRMNFGLTIGGGSAGNAVPEPRMPALACCALAFLSSVYRWPQRRFSNRSI